MVDEWREARTTAKAVIEKLTQAQRKRRQKVSALTLERAPRKGLHNQQAHGSAEYVRSVSLVLWMAQNDTEREQIKALAEEISDLAEERLHELEAKDAEACKRFKHRLGDHLWCDCLAALVVALDEIQGIQGKLADDLATACAELAAIAWREVKASRETSHGSGPTSSVV